MGNWLNIRFYTYMLVSVVKFKDPLRHRQMKNRQLNRCAEKRSLSSLSKAQKNTPLVGSHNVVDRQVHSVFISKITDKITTCIRCTKAPTSSCKRRDWWSLVLGLSTDLWPSLRLTLWSVLCFYRFCVEVFLHLFDCPSSTSPYKQTV